MSASPFSAAAQGLGYFFQYRFSLLRALELPDGGQLFLERNDDVEHVAADGSITAASLKHKAEGERLTDLATDFWKSVRIWLTLYIKTGHGAGSDIRFILVTTASVPDDSFMSLFLGHGQDDMIRLESAKKVLSMSKSDTISRIAAELDALAIKQQRDFLGRISIVQETDRIDQLPAIIEQRLRAVDRRNRQAVFERLEGWWVNVVTNHLVSRGNDPIYISDVSDKLSAINDAYKSDNLPIDFLGKTPESIDAASDNRTFVEQLRVLGLSEERIRRAIIDYYRAFQQRSSWARESLLVSNEIELYEDRLVEEWDRFREIACELLTDGSGEEVCRKAGRELYDWAQLNTGNLRIRERVTEPYVVRGTFQMLANADPQPRVYWHPRFLERLANALEVTV
ncbi:hypothetical protein ATH84_104421 [Paracoccus versutus]|uniref:ABC-three component systems C-terminal domain-containing protein n=1 Tax=Paracoccus versutus TaxID=34007 RepID=A0AAQ0HDX0_PARVE|nr:ABC-three component system protein [Paracoccus versutus]KGJ07689.1 hypothetical protein IT40_20295 [Paracoccus versutus]REG32696.1 hypothetical protein ATH84_104421 [Paracoccus versutus]